MARVLRLFTVALSLGALGVTLAHGPRHAATALLAVAFAGSVVAALARTGARR